MKAPAKAALASLAAAALVLANGPEAATPASTPETPLPSAETIERAVVFAEQQACDAGRVSACYRLNGGRR